MESVEVRFGRGDKRRTLGWFVVGTDGWLKYKARQYTEIISAPETFTQGDLDYLRSRWQAVLND